MSAAVVEVVVGAAAVIVSAAVLGGFALIVRLGRSQRQFQDDWRGEPARPGVPERPGVMVRLSRIEAGQTYQGQVQAVQGQYLEQVWHELHPNSGLSMRDAVSRIHLATTGHPDPGGQQP